MMPIGQRTMWRTPDNPPRPIGIPAALPSLAADNPKAKPTIPRQFPAPEKRLTPPKDFLTVYMDAQSQVTRLEREKFEYMKESDKAARAAAAVVDMRQAKSPLIEKLVASGVVVTLCRLPSMKNKKSDIKRSELDLQLN
ncbi:hypothetical protein DYB28_006929 [Aphanomyces astaci]|uniref:Uncharacterized protein n=1 Tax=Aphanomyces astaci TaxID=112090 RepID=A0A397DK45_APHAT|nr:hypothetical protein DYB30_011091 [Aphanomyces astaci]RLO09372.1 hypothetical protein DYB28_006929 [Aphanomyces astaci]